MLHIERFQVNMLQENCYVVSDETKECVIIDCGAFYPEERTSELQSPCNPVCRLLLEKMLHCATRVCR